MIVPTPLALMMSVSVPEIRKVAEGEERSRELVGYARTLRALASDLEHSARREREAVTA